MSQNFVNYANATALMQAIATKFSALNGAYVIKGNSTFANLPETPTATQNGYVYNVTDEFETDSRFVEGAGKTYAAGTNVVIVDLSTYQEVTPQAGDNPSTEGWYELVNGKYVASADTEVDSEKTYYAKTVVVKYDVLGMFVDVEALEAATQAVSDMISGEFDDATSYSTGDVVVKEGKLYIFTDDHAAGAWDAGDVSETTVADLIANAEPEALTTEQVNTLIGLLG